MNKKMIFFGLMMLVLMLSISACGGGGGGSFSTANINEAWLSTDEAGEERVTSFTQDAVLYAQVDLKNAPDDTVVKAVWIAVEAEGADPNYVINETEQTAGDSMMHFKMSNTTPWPLGSYKVDIYLNGELNQTLEFTVE